MGKNVGRERPSFITDLVENTHTHEYTPTPTHTYKTKESKSARVNLLMKPSVKQELTDYAKRTGTSMNDIINMLVEDFLKENN